MLVDPGGRFRVQPTWDGMEAETFPGFLVFRDFMLVNTALLHIGAVSFAEPVSAVHLLVTTTLILLNLIPPIEPTCYRAEIIFIRRTVHAFCTHPSCALSTVVEQNFLAHSLC